MVIILNADQGIGVLSCLRDCETPLPLGLQPTLLISNAAMQHLAFNLTAIDRREGKPCGSRTYVAFERPEVAFAIVTIQYSGRL